MKNKTLLDYWTGSEVCPGSKENVLKELSKRRKFWLELLFFGVGILVQSFCFLFFTTDIIHKLGIKTAFLSLLPSITFTILLSLFMYLNKRPNMNNFWMYKRHVKSLADRLGLKPQLIEAMDYTTLCRKFVYPTLDILSSTCVRQIIAGNIPKALKVYYDHRCLCRICAWFGIRPHYELPEFQVLKGEYGRI